jgi:hypothetical protein
VTVTRSMTPVTCWLCALALALSSQAAQAAPEWKINPDGTGAGSATTVSTIDVGGAGFVQILPDIGGPTFQFVEHGAYQVLKADGSAPFGTRDLTVTYSVSGTGNFLNPAELRFTSGAIDLYADPISDFASATSNYGADNGTHVARFSVFDGGVTPLGMVGVQASIVPGSLLAGYLFAADGSDLAARDNAMMELVIFNETVVPDALLVSEVVCGMAGYGGPGCDGTPFANSDFAYAVRDGGYVTVSSVPEPETIGMMLVGLGLISVVTRRRRSSLN